MGRYEQACTAVMAGSVAGVLGLGVWASRIARHIEDQQEAFLERNRKAFQDEIDNTNWEYHIG